MCQKKKDSHLFSLYCSILLPIPKQLVFYCCLTFLKLSLAAVCCYEGGPQTFKGPKRDDGEWLAARFLENGWHLGEVLWLIPRCCPGVGTTFQKLRCFQPETAGPWDMRKPLGLGDLASLISTVDQLLKESSRHFYII